MTKKLKLVGAERYISPLTNNEVVEKGRMFTFEDKIADTLLTETRSDALNNTHRVWEEVGGTHAVVESGDQATEDDEDAPAVVASAKPARAARTATAAKKSVGK